MKRCKRTNLKEKLSGYRKNTLNISSFDDKESELMNFMTKENLYNIMNFIDNYRKIETNAKEENKIPIMFSHFEEARKRLNCLS